MTDELKTLSARRKLLKSLVAGGGAAVTANSLPDKWAKPVVDSVLLPAHAQTTTCQVYVSDWGSDGNRLANPEIDIPVALERSGGNAL